MGRFSAVLHGSLNGSHSSERTGMSRILLYQRDRKLQKKPEQLRPAYDSTSAEQLASSFHQMGFLT